MFPTHYQGGTQDDGTNDSSHDLEHEIEDLSSGSINNIKNQHDKPLLVNMGRCYFPLDQGDLDDVVLPW